tara:strand:- start:64875 stop:65591 length:717 start_codon:yes stop_codon:yes gene_type:complete
MSLVPSGRRRVQVAQSFSSQSTGLGGDDVAQDSFYADPQQQQGQQEAPAFDFNALQQNMEQDQAAPQPSAEDIDGAVNGEQGGDSDLAGNLESFIIQRLVSLGVPERMFGGKDGVDPFFQWDEDLDSETSSGFYLIPSFTATQKIGRDEAKQLATEIGQKFNLSQKITKEGRNYKVKFQTKIAEPEAAQFGTSLDDVIKPGTFQQGDSKAASSRHPYITGSKDSVLASIQKQLDRRVK